MPNVNSPFSARNNTALIKKFKEERSREKRKRRVYIKKKKGSFLYIVTQEDFFTLEGPKSKFCLHKYLLL